ncbi:TonB-dependent receptor [Flavivirga jejuensis]|uniref:TonB-dependent receptor plug domain-containing protein n=1 Tax=Flavivirga jejuensis TaxID=870487 RepID=A0ABT8WLX6_9FLAO|nr:TonB-dependent receptor plug domain-containing protein [Flavivirga jejuensis]MDO5974148.1 TonB-dependent receptor plug domain-containing protein [Flavivirga jejuensis]
MKKNIKKAAIFFSLLFFITNCIYAQDTGDSRALSQIITTLQEAYDIQFNYAEDVINEISLKPPAKKLPLPEVLAYLENHTGLSFALMNDSFILVKPRADIILCGYLKDRDNLRALASATVQTSDRFTTSDENGFFQIKIKNVSQLITIRYLGYGTITRSYDQFKRSGCEDVYLQPDLQLLSQVIISNYITSGINKIDNGSFQIDFSNLKILPGLIDNDVLQSVQAFPGIQSVNETVSNINIRGGTHDQNLMLWDDIKMYQSGHFFGLISMYNPHITQKVSLRKNGSHVSYSDGVSGTIAMQTDHKVNSEFKGVIGVNLIDVNGFADIPINESSSIQVAARKSISDFVETPTYSAFFDRISQNTEVASNVMAITNTNKTFDFYDTSLRWIYNINDKEELRVNFINAHNQLQFNENAIIDETEESRDSRLDQNSIAGALHYKRVWSDTFSTDLEIYETDYKLRAINVNILDSQRFLQENIVSETSTKLKVSYILDTRLQLLNGYHFVETEVTNLDDVDNPLFRSLISEVVRTHSVFSQVDYKTLDNKTNLNIGLRYNYIGKFNKSILEPRLSFNHRFFKHFTLEVLGEFKHQNVSQVINFQNDFLGIEKRRWQLSNNKDIPVITSKQISMGLNYSYDGWLIAVDGFYKIIDGITTQSQGFQNQYEFVKSQGRYDVKGVDVLLRKHIERFNTWLSYSYMNNRYLFKDLETNYFPSNYNISHTATLGMTYALNNLKVSAGFNWHSGKPTTKPVFGNEIINERVNYEATNASTLNDYLRLDVSATYNFKLANKARANLGISVWNILDKENQINNFYRVKDGNITETVQNSLGFTPNAVFRVYF